MSTNLYEGSVSVTTRATTLSSSMISNGWQFKDRSTDYRTIWQFTRPLDNGRYDEIRFNNHGKEGSHYLIKKMIRQEEKPTRERFIHSIAPELKNSIDKTLGKDISSIPFSLTFSLRMKLCSQCGSEISANSKSCPFCGTPVPS